MSGGKKLNVGVVWAKISVLEYGLENKKSRKIACVLHCKDTISKAENYPDFFNSFIADSEIWCSKYGPETKRQSAESQKGSRRLEKKKKINF